MKPSIGRTVHFVSHDSFSCRAAIITEVEDTGDVSLTVFKPQAIYFKTGVEFHDPDRDGFYLEGTWHWPERVDE